MNRLRSRDIATSSQGKPFGGGKLREKKHEHRFREKLASFSAHRIKGTGIVEPEAKKPKIRQWKRNNSG